MKFFILFFFCCFDSLAYSASIPDYEEDSSDDYSDYYSWENCTDEPIEERENRQDSTVRFAPLLPQDYSPIVSKQVGESLHLYCGFDLKKLDRSEIKTINWWKYRDDGHPELISSDDNRIYTTSIQEHEKFRLKLNIEEIREEDARDYLCIAMTYLDLKWQKIDVKLVVT